MSNSNLARNFGYDNAGDTTSDSGNYSATYDAAGRLQTLTKAGVSTTYSYDGFGRRVRKFSNSGASSTVIFVYDQQGQLLGEYSNTGAMLREYAWVGSTPIAMFVPNGSSTTIYHLHTDHLDTPRIVTDAAGNVRWRWLAEPFGSTFAENNPSNLGAVTQNLRFPGQYFDQESGLHYNHWRYYSSTEGRYNTSDPIGLGGGINTYAYVEANPLSFADPNGLIKIPGVPGADGETSVHANPGPNATDFRPEHGPDHIHLGQNDGPRVRTSDFKPFSEDDAKKLSRKQKQFCEGLSEASRDKIRKAQQSIFKHGRIILQIQAGGMLSIAAACRADPVWCADQIEAGVLP